MSLTASRALKQARAGNRDALIYLYAAYADDVYGHARTMVDDHEGALSVTQCVFARLSGLLSRYEEQEVSFAIWLRRVAQSVAGEALADDEAQPSGYSV